MSFFQAALELPILERTIGSPLMSAHAFNIALLVFDIHLPQGTGTTARASLFDMQSLRQPQRWQLVFADNSMCGSYTSFSVSMNDGYPSCDRTFASAYLLCTCTDPVDGKAVNFNLQYLLR